MSEWIHYALGMFLGWSIGANDSANMFGTAVASRMVRFRTAVLLIACFVILGAYLQGAAGIHTVSSLGIQHPRLFLICIFSAAMTLTFMSILKIPVSSSQLMIGAVIGISLITDTIRWYLLTKVLICWLVNPLGSMVIAAWVYKFLSWLARYYKPSIFSMDCWIRAGLLVFGSYGAYALGANGVAIVSIPFIGNDGYLIPVDSLQWATVLGGIAIGIGAVTYSKPVMHTVGKGIIPMNGFSALVAVLALSISVHLFAIIGVPVSSSQSIIGALLGIGWEKGLTTINFYLLRWVLFWWVVSPLISAGLAICIYYLL